jgi:hypothetical protein
MLAQGPDRTAGTATPLWRCVWYHVLRRSATFQSRSRILSATARTIRDKAKLLNRVRRIRAQVDGIEKLVAEQDFWAILQTIAACRHICLHVVNPDRHPTSGQAKATHEPIHVIKSYVK